MSWVADHQILLAAIALLMLVAIGLAILVSRAVGLVRAAKHAQERVDPPVRAISTGLQRAEQRVGELQDHQADMLEAVERVGARTAELQTLLGAAGKALAVLRAPFRYLGK